MGWVVIRVPILCLPIGSNETSRLFEVRSLIEMFFSALDLSLHAATSLAPLSQVSRCFFIAPLVAKLFVLVFEPDCFEFLLFKIIGRMVHEIV